MTWGKRLRSYYEDDFEEVEESDVEPDNRDTSLKNRILRWMKCLLGRLNS